MHSAKASIVCPVCQAANPESHKFCQRCRSSLPKRWLWIVGAERESLRSGTLLGDRYWVKQPQIVLDTQPGQAPEFPETLSEGMLDYLHLSPYQLHVPQVFGVVMAGKRSPQEWLLLEHAPIHAVSLDDDSDSATGTLMPELRSMWQHASALQQLGWLWQLARLWQPLHSERVAATLLAPERVRVDGSIVRLLELQPDGRSPTLAELGQQWQQWHSGTQPEIADFVQELCQQLLQAQIRSADQLVELLDRALAGSSPSQTRQIQIATRTDQGPTRQRNEDACYPPSGTVATFSTATELPIVVVCDGIGGHEGGNIASNLAIETMLKQLQPIAADLNASHPATLMAQLEQATLAANDAISQRNDGEQRLDRQRMGTTLVMALVHAHTLYLTHIGDSRAHRITRTGCRQVTLDDDLASREVRLGYALYQEALQQAGSGSLVQALGMGESSALHPTVQPFVLDEDCLFLLCSDGLSDFDRVESLWQPELVPVLEGKVNLATACQRLVALANQQNGHDNVTVGLLHCQVMPGKAVQLDRAIALPAGDRLPKSPAAATPLTANQRTAVLPTGSSGSHPLMRLLGVVLLWGMGSLLVYAVIPGVREWVDSWVSGRSPIPTATPTATPPEITPTSPPTPAAIPATGALVQLNRAATTATGQPIALAFQPQPGISNSPPITPATLPINTVLEVVDRKATPDQATWLQLKVCSIPSEAKAMGRTVQPGDSGWIPVTTLLPLITSDISLTKTQSGQCTPSPTPQRTPSSQPTPRNSP
jgi:serine/threonine protein phosphatase PrpC